MHHYFGRTIRYLITPPPIQCNHNRTNHNNNNSCDLASCRRRRLFLCGFILRHTVQCILCAVNLKDCDKAATTTTTTTINHTFETLITRTPPTLRPGSLSLSLLQGLFVYHPPSAMILVINDNNHCSALMWLVPS